MIKNFNFNNKTFFIAEIGNNHEGSLQHAYDLVGLAAESGANAVKFQTINPLKLVSFDEKERLTQLEKLCLKYEDFRKISNFAKKSKISFLSTPFDLDGAEYLNKLQDTFKISSSDNNYFELLDRILSFRKDLIISTGLMNLNQIKDLYKRVMKKWRGLKSKPILSFLHCVSAYPVTTQYANLGAITTLRKEFPDCLVGYSDHLLGIKGAIYACVLGAQIIEKHFTSDKKFSSFRDHKISATPNEFKKMVKSVIEAKEMIGDSKKKIESIEKVNISNVRRSVYAKKKIQKGEKLTKMNTICLRPNRGISAEFYEDYIGRKKIKKVKEIGQPIFKNDTE